MSEDKAVKEIVDFGDQQVFNEATTYTALVFLKNEKMDTMKYCLVKKLSENIEQMHEIRDKLTVPVSYNERRQQRDLLYINDAINGIIQVINYQHDGFNVFNISSGKRYSINDLVSIIKKISNTKISMKYNSKIPDERYIWADNSKAKKILKFDPKFDIESGLKSTINQY